MKNLKALIASTFIVLFTISSQAQIKNAVTSTVEINGNCGMCKKTIETAAYEPKIAKAEWDEDTHMAVLTFDANKTSEEAILKKIAQAGYDNQSFRAPDDVYAKLHECCRYDRAHTIATDDPIVHDQTGHQHHQDASNNQNNTVQNQQTQSSESNNQLDPVFKSYINLKNALVASDSKSAQSAAQTLKKSITSVDMSTLNTSVHELWMKVIKSLENETTAIEKATDLTKQRNSFMNLSNQIYSLAKVSKTTIPLYLQFCPMANAGKGAHWLSLEEEIKNPYYGSKMMTCGEVKEKI